MTSPAEIRASIKKTRAAGPLLLALGAALIALPLVVEAKSETEARYPFDPACPWGRLSNGQGMLHRCLTRGEAEDLARGDNEKSEPAKKEPSTPKDKPKENGPEREKEPLPRDYSLNVGPIKADEGDISVGALNKPMDRYRECVDKQGGLKAKKAEVVVKFLVRGEKVRAEGVSVDTFSGVSQAAADCIASVVDRRRVGAPSVPLTAARLTFSMEQK